MIAILKLLWGSTGGKVLGIGMAITLLALSGALAWERHSHGATRTKLMGMTEARNLEAAAHRQTKANYAAAAHAAQLEHELVKLTIEKQWKGQVDEIEQSSRDELARALDLAAAAGGRVRGNTPARTGAAGAPGRADPADLATTTAPAGGAGGVPQLDDRDLRICTANTVKARGWQAFYEGLGAAQDRVADAGKVMGDE